MCSSRSFSIGSIPLGTLSISENMSCSSASWRRTQRYTQEGKHSGRVQNLYAPMGYSVTHLWLQVSNWILLVQLNNRWLAIWRLNYAWSSTKQKQEKLKTNAHPLWRKFPSRRSWYITLPRMGQTDGQAENIINSHMSCMLTAVQQHHSTHCLSRCVWSSPDIQLRWSPWTRSPERSHNIP